MSITLPFAYRRLGDSTDHVLSDPAEIRAYLMKWIMPEWQPDHSHAPQECRRGLEEHAGERAKSIEPLLINRQGFALMDGYTRYTVLKRYRQGNVFAYVGTPGGQPLPAADPV